MYSFITALTVFRCPCLHTFLQLVFASYACICSLQQCTPPLFYTIFSIDMAQVHQYGYKGFGEVVNEVLYSFSCLVMVVISEPGRYHKLQGGDMLLQCWKIEVQTF